MLPLAPAPKPPVPTAVPTAATKTPLVLALCNGKGGSNKTTGSLNLSAELATRGFTVLLIDLDQAGDATKSLAPADYPWNGTTEEVLFGSTRLGESIVPTALPTLWLLPADKQMRGLEQRLLKDRPYDFAQLLKTVLRQQAGAFDYVVLDCPGSLDALTVVALVAAHFFVVPCEPEYFSFDGAKAMLEVAENLTRQNLTPDLQFAGLFFSPYNPRKRNSGIQVKVVKAAHKLFPGQVFSNVREDAGIRLSQVERIPLVQLDPNARAVADFRLLTTEILQAVGHGQLAAKARR